MRKPVQEVLNSRFRNRKHFNRIQQNCGRRLITAHSCGIPVQRRRKKPSFEEDEEGGRSSVIVSQAILKSGRGSVEHPREPAIDLSPLMRLMASAILLVTPILIFLKLCHFRGMVLKH